MPNLKDLIVDHFNQNGSLVRQVCQTRNATSTMAVMIQSTSKNADQFTAPVAVKMLLKRGNGGGDDGCSTG